MRELDYPFIRCMGCEGIALSPRRLCSHCETQEAMKTATIRGRCSNCQYLTVLTHDNLLQGEDGRYTLLCDACRN